MAASRESRVELRGRGELAGLSWSCHCVCVCVWSLHRLRSKPLAYCWLSLGDVFLVIWSWRGGKGLKEEQSFFGRRKRGSILLHACIVRSKNWNLNFPPFCIHTYGPDVSNGKNFGRICVLMMSKVLLHSVLKSVTEITVWVWEESTRNTLNLLFWFQGSPLMSP